MKEPQCPLDLSVEYEEDILHSYGPSTSIYVSLLPCKTEGGKLVIEDCPKELEEELIYNMSRNLKEVAYYCCLGADDC